jgi:2-aminoethylphosphonate-pyruvate transaminase
MGGPVLLTPGPLTTSRATRAAAAKDWGSWDTDFQHLTRRVVEGLEGVAGADRLACVPMQGSGTFAVEAAVRTFTPRGEGIVVLSNGAYGDRLAKLAALAGREVEVLATPWDAPPDLAALARALEELPGRFRQVAMVHCETSTGLLNPLRQTADVVAASGRRLIVDAMSSFGALDVAADHPAVTAIAAASGKCLEGLPGVGFVLADRAALAAADGACDSLSLDLADQHRYLATTGQWRFTPPTHLVAALAAALDQHRAEGGAPGRLARYQANSKTLAAGMIRLGFEPFLPARWQAPIIHTFHAPTDPAWDFDQFYDRVKRRGFILYPGKLTETETFRVGCVGAIEPDTMRRAVGAMAAALMDMGVAVVLPEFQEVAA